MHQNPMLRPRLRRSIVMIAAVALLALPALAVARSTVRAHAASSTVLETVKTSYGPLLAASTGHVLYAFDKDSKSHSACNSACQKVWKPYLVTGSLTVKSGAGLNAKLLGTLTVSGHKQAEYAGHPLYTYVKDTKAAQLNGEAVSQFGGDWYVVGPKGKPEACNPNLSCSY